MVNWKVIAIVVMILFVVENIFLWVGYEMLEREEERALQCSYEFCAEYPSFAFDDPICTCYDYDNLGYLIPVEEGLIK